MRVVIAEDNALLREGLELLLHRNGLEVVAMVGSAPEVLPALAEHRPDVAVVDVRLPPAFRDEGLRAAHRRRAAAARAAGPGAVPVRRRGVRRRAARRRRRRRRLPAQGPGRPGGASSSTHCTGSPPAAPRWTPRWSPQLLARDQAGPLDASPRANARCWR